MPKPFGFTSRSLVSGLSLGLLSACTTTVDSLGYDPVPLQLYDIKCTTATQTSPPNAFSNVLGVTALQCTNKLDAAYASLFHGDAKHAIFFPGDSDQCEKLGAVGETACIQDTLHGDVRTEGLGLGMLVSVLLNHRDEFDQLWRYAQLKQYKTGAAAGYFESMCDTSLTEKRKCLDPYGLQQFVMALLLAKARWSPDATRPDYAAGALQLLTLLRTKVISNGGIVDGVTNTFDSKAKLPYDEPNNGGKHFLGTALATPGYYDVWAMVTGDPFYTEAAAAGREFLRAASHSDTGLYPIAANFDGTAKEGSEVFAAAAFRVDLNLVIDKHWGTPENEQVDYQLSGIERMLGFFTEQGLTTYGSRYALEGGKPLITDHAAELVMANAVIASLSTAPNKKDYLQAAWALEPPVEPTSYYTGLIYLIGNLILTGQFRLCP